MHTNYLDNKTKYCTYCYSYRKTNQSESADDEVRENEETAVSDSSAIKDSETKVCEPSIQGDQEQVDSSTTEPLLSEIKEEGKEKTGDDAPEEEKKEENSEAVTTENTGKKKPAARKRSSTGKSSKSSRSSK